MKYLIALALPALVFSCSPAYADVFAYKTDNGVFAYTDDLKKVPEKYRAGAKAVPQSKVTEPQFTVVKPDADLVSMRQRARLDALRASNEADLAARRAARSRVEAAKPAPQPLTVIVIQPRVERHGLPQRHRGHGRPKGS